MLLPGQQVQLRIRKTVTNVRVFIEFIGPRQTGYITIAPISAGEDLLIQNSETPNSPLPPQYLNQVSVSFRTGRPGEKLATNSKLP